ncbi:MAG: glycosyltransferase, partial [Massilia sp.]
PVFSAPLSRAVCARELRLDPGTITLLVMGGSPALGSVVQVAAHLLGMDVKLQIIALAGKSAPTLAALKDLAERHPGRLAPQGYTDKIERLMACADIVVTKPGGLTTSESLAMGLPMVVISPIPGQEEFNANFLLEQGVALQAFDLVTLEYRIRHLLDHPAHLDQMRAKARSLGRPNAAGKVLGIALGKTEG